MYFYIEPRFEEINSDIFFNLFRIKYLIIFKEELQKININNFKIIKEFNNYNSPILLLEKINNNKVVLTRYSSNNKILNCEPQNSVSCIIKKENFLKLHQDINIERIGLNNYKVSNNSINKLSVILPFLYEKSWNSKNAEILNIDKSIMFINLNPTESSEIFYQNDERLILKVISIMTFIFLIIFIIRNKLIKSS